MPTDEVTGRIQRSEGKRTVLNLDELRSLRGQGMISAVGEYTPTEFWDALDEIERLRELVREAYEKADLGWLVPNWDERAAEALGVF